jgi:hypothetical protein
LWYRDYFLHFCSFIKKNHKTHLTGLRGMTIS